MADRIMRMTDRLLEKYEDMSERYRLQLEENKRLKKRIRELEQELEDD